MNDYENIITALNTQIVKTQEMLSAAMRIVSDADTRRIMYDNAAVEQAKDRKAIEKKWHEVQEKDRELKQMRASVEEQERQIAIKSEELITRQAKLTKDKQALDQQKAVFTRDREKLDLDIVNNDSLKEREARLIEREKLTIMNEKLHEDKKARLQTWEKQLELKAERLHKMLAK